MTLQFLQAEHGSAAYQDTLKLREAALRRPLGRVLSAADIANDANQTHLGAYEGNALLACLSLLAHPPVTMQLRQMAVEEKTRGKGVGASLVRFAETWSRDRGYQDMWLKARVEAQGFYATLGYAVDGDVFDEIGIPHIIMRKSL